MDEQEFQRLGAIAQEAAQAAYAAIEGIGRLTPLIGDLMRANVLHPEAEIAALREFSAEVALRTAYLARTVSEDEGFETAPWEIDARLIVPVLLELTSVYLLLSHVSSPADFDDMPSISTYTLRRIVTKQRRAWLYHLLGVQ